MSNDLKATILSQLEAMLDCFDCVASVCISRNILVNGLDSNLKPGASVHQHLTLFYLISYLNGA